jgi:hypothetical protein
VWKRGRALRNTRVTRYLKNTVNQTDGRVNHEKFAAPVPAPPGGNEN